jgi:hypothetical protein
MTRKTVLTVALGLFVLAGVAAVALRCLQNPPAQAETASPLGPGTKLVACYFSGNNRCPACDSIETSVREAVETGFPEELKSGRLEWQSINYEQPGNEHFATDFELVAPGLVLVAVRDGRPGTWKSLPEVWKHVGDKPATVDCVRRGVRELLDAARN